MSSPIDQEWLTLSIENHLKIRLTPTQIINLKKLPESIYPQLAEEIEKSISTYNTDLEKFFLYKNSQHLKTLINKLPSYSLALRTLKKDSSLYEHVFDELSNSTYFNDVYKIIDPLHLLANLMTLIYRGYMLHSNPMLRANSAQISSTLEEMSAHRYLSGNDSLHFQGTKHWILDWEGEDFSEELSNQIKKRLT